MTLRLDHEMIGGIIGIIFATWLYMLGFNIVFVGGCFLIALLGATLPDLLDPTKSQFNNGIGHNYVSFAMFIIISTIGLTASMISFKWPFILATAFSLSALSHLIIDMSTPSGLFLFANNNFWGIVEITLFLIPGVNVCMIMIVLIMAGENINYLAKKIGGTWSMLLLFIPVWGALLLLGLLLLTIESPYGAIVGIILLLLFVVVFILLAMIGSAIDIALKKSVRLIDVLRGKLKPF